MKKLPSPIKDTELPYCALGISIEKQIIVKKSKKDWDGIFEWISNEEQ